MFTPNVRPRIRRISARTCSAPRYPAARNPRPPASLTAAASSTVDGPPAIGACTTGCWMSASTPTTRGTGRALLLCGRRPPGTWVGQRGELRLDLLPVRLQLRRQDHLRPEFLERHVDGEAWAVVGDLEQHSAGLAEVDRVEVVTIDDPGCLHACLAQELLPARMLSD